MENEHQNSIDYLNKKTNRDVGFSIPQKYFDDIENDIIVKLAEDNLVKTKGFETPDSYFGTLEDTILRKVLPSQKEVKVISLKERILKFVPMAAAASVLLFIGLNFFDFDKSDDSIDQLDDNDLENWFSDNIDLINDTDIAYAYTDIDIDESELIPNSISNDELEDYLDSEEDISLIIETEE